MSLRNQYRYIKSRYLKRIAGDLLFARDQIVNVVAKSYRDVSHDVSISLNDKKVTSKMGYFILSTILISNYIVTENSHYLSLLYKTLDKTPAKNEGRITISII